MAKRTVPCPKCKSPITMPETPQTSLACPKCNAKFKVSAPKPAAVGAVSPARGSPAPAPGSAPQRAATPDKASSPRAASRPATADDSPAPDEARKGVKPLTLALAGGGLAVVVAAVVVVAIMMQPGEPEKKQVQDDKQQAAAPTPGDGKQEGEKEPNTGGFNSGKPDGGTNKVPDVVPPPPEDKDAAETAAAVERGRVFLKGKVMSLKGSGVDQFTPTARGKKEAVFALMGLALLETGYPVDDEAVKVVAEIIRANASKLNKNYDLATCLFFLNRWNEGFRDIQRKALEEKKGVAAIMDEKERKAAQEEIDKEVPSSLLEAPYLKVAQTFALRLTHNQLASGVWLYGDVKFASGAVAEIPMTAEEESQLLANLKSGAYKPTTNWVRYSMSNTQFAMLALWGARKHGIPVRDTLLRVADFCHNNQYPDGHWSYNGNPKIYETMSSTCCALIALAVEKALLESPEFVKEPEKRERARRADPDSGFEYIAKYGIGRKMGDPYGAEGDNEKGTLFGADSWGDLYFLWCVERLGMIYPNKDKEIKGKNWYEWGRPLVVKSQKPDGSWEDRHGPLVDTCFALLFLKRANIAKDLAEALIKLSGLFEPRPGPAMRSRPPGVPDQRSRYT